MHVAVVAAGAAMLGSAYYTKRTEDNQKKMLKNSNKSAKTQADLDRQAAQALLQEQQRKNRNLLKQQQSSYRARLGASGLSYTNGSGQVVLDNMQKEHDMEDRYLIKQANISKQSLENSLKETTKRNLLSLDNMDSNQKRQALDAFSSAIGRSLIK